MSAELFAALEQCGDFFRSETLRRHSYAEVLVSALDPVIFRAPMLRPNLKLGSVDFNHLVRLLYGPPDIPQSLLADEWTRALSLPSTATEQRRAIFSSLFPALPFSSVLGEQRADLAQYLIASSWYGGRLMLSSESIYLRLDKRRLWMSQRMIEDGRGIRGFARPFGMKPTEIQSYPLGRPRACLALTGAVYRELLLRLPGLERQVDIAFAIAVRAGLEYEAALTKTFLIQRLDDVERASPARFEKALQLIDYALRPPLEALREVLVPDLMTERAFKAAFKSRSAERYLPALRQRHRTLIVNLQTKLNLPLKLAACSGASHSSHEANQILELQQLIRGNRDDQ